MNSREKEYKELFIAEALEIYDGLSNNITKLEKEPQNDKVLAELFRLLHNLKANARAMGFTDIADISHKLETIFSALRSNQFIFEGGVITILLDGIDLLGILIANIDEVEQTEPAQEVVDNIDRLVSVTSGDGELDDLPIKKYYTSQNISLSEQIYIPIRKLDDMLNLVGELIIDRDRIISISNELENAELKNIASHLYRITNEIQNAVMDSRLIAIGSLFNKFPRIVRDIALVEDKSVNLEITGQDIKIDRNILQIITDSMLHLVRNAINHGIETEEERVAKGKPPTGKIHLSAFSDKDQVVIKIKDDGCGIDPDKIRNKAIEKKLVSAEKAKDMTAQAVLGFIFEPGFSLSKTINEFSGRGVGLDIVKTAIDTIGGRIAIDSIINQGTTFNLILPTSIAVKASLLFEVDGTSYAIPLVHTDSVVTIHTSEIHQLGLSMIADIKNETVPVVNLMELFNTKGHQFLTGDTTLLEGNYQHVIVVTYNNRKLGLIVEKLLRQQDIVVKPLQRPIDNIELFGGVTLLGTGEVCLVLDVPSISKMLTGKNFKYTEELTL